VILLGVDPLLSSVCAYVLLDFVDMGIVRSLDCSCLIAFGELLLFCECSEE
jgi:hypothetical protein